jgi:hypothetical protein
MPQSSLTRGSAKIVNRATAGGNKKAGLPSLIGRSQPLSNHIKTKAFPRNGQKFVISSVNQMGGIGRVQSMTQAPADGVNKNVIYAMKTKWTMSYSSLSEQISPS